MMIITYLYAIVVVVGCVAAILMAVICQALQAKERNFFYNISHFSWP